jgi:hypothetical protein
VAALGLEFLAGSEHSSMSGETVALGAAFAVAAQRSGGRRKGDQLSGLTEEKIDALS